MEEGNVGGTLDSGFSVRLVRPTKISTGVIPSSRTMRTTRKNTKKQETSRTQKTKAKGMRTRCTINIRHSGKTQKWDPAEAEEIATTTSIIITVNGDGASSRP